METTNNHFSGKLGWRLGRSVCGMLRSRNTRATLAILLLPIAAMLLFAYIIGAAIQGLEELFAALAGTKKEIVKIPPS